MRWRDDPTAWERVLYLSSLEPSEMTDAEQAEAEEVRKIFWKATDPKGKPAWILKAKTQEIRAEWFAENVRAINDYRKQHKMTQSQFCKMFGLSPSWQTMLNTQKSLPKKEVADRIYEVTGLKLYTAEDMKAYKNQLRSEM